MLKEFKENPMYRYLLLLSIAMAAGFQGWRTLFNNYAVEEVGINGFQNGIIQSVREIPGLLSLLVVFLLLFLKEHRIAAIGALVLGVGVAATGLFPSFGGLIVCTLIMSLGFHYFETVNQSLTLQYFSHKDAPIVLGNIKSYIALTNIITGIIIWTLSNHLKYSNIFMFFGVAVILVGLYAFTKNPVDKNLPIQKKKMVLKKKYSLFYILNFLSGARRQIFVVFVVFMMVKKYNFSIQTITILFIINNIINYFMAPVIGKLINKIGERFVLSCEYITLTIIFLLYTFVDNKTLIFFIYIANNVFFSASMAINTFFQKTADTEDIAPSMGVSFTINHILAIIVPVIGGALWMYNWRLPFFVGSGIAFISLLTAQKVRTK
jgi:predicted MFS family arabinose efflux permease